MMEVAQKFAKKIYFTSDNNRNESFTSIFSDAIADNRIAFLKIIEDRKEAIRMALEDLNSKNLLVILGKGHEEYMEVSGKKIPFNDKECVLKILSNDLN